MAGANPLKKVFDWLNAQDVTDEEHDDMEMSASNPTSAVDRDQKRQRGPLVLRTGNDGGMEIRHPRNLDDRMAIGMDLKHRRLVTLDLTQLPDAEARFFLEFIYGVVFALDATAEKVTDGIYLLAPRGVAVRNDADNDSELPAAKHASRAAKPRDVQEEMFWQGS